MKVTILILCAILLCGGSVRARIGDTPEQLDQRYGTPTARGMVVTKDGQLAKAADPEAVVRLRNGIYVETMMRGGCCCWIRFTKKNDGNPVNISSADLSSLMVANLLPAHRWGEIEGRALKDGKPFLRATATDHAEFLCLDDADSDGGGKVLTIFTKEWADSAQETFQSLEEAKRKLDRANAKVTTDGF